MPWFIVDTRDRVAQRVTENAPDAPPRFVKVQADTLRAAFDQALSTPKPPAPRVNAAELRELAALKIDHCEDCGPEKRP